MEHKDLEFFLFNFIFWVVFYISFYYSVAFAPGTKTEITSTLSPLSVDEITVNDIGGRIEAEDIDYESLSDTEASSVLADALAGEYTSLSGYTFYFGQNGYYDGFFDSDNNYIEGGTFEIYQNENDAVLAIISPDGKRKVSFTLLMNGPDGFSLVYEPTGFIIELEKEK